MKARNAVTDVKAVTVVTRGRTGFAIIVTRDGANAVKTVGVVNIVQNVTHGEK